MIDRDEVLALVAKWREQANEYVSDLALGITSDEVAAIRECADELQALAAKAEAQGGEVCEVRNNDDGTLDEVVGTGWFHLEQMDTNRWWMSLGPHGVWLRAKGKITAHVELNAYAAAPKPAGVG